MTSVEQHKMVQSLKQVVRKMTSEEKNLFEMLSKRDHDDEDLDSMSRAKLQQLYEKYFPKHSKKELDDKWNSVFSRK